MMLFLLTNVTSLTAQQQSSENTNSLIGCWQDDADKNIFVRFEPNKYFHSYNGMKFVTKVRYESGRISHRSRSGESYVWEVIVESGKLSIFWGKKT